MRTYLVTLSAVFATFAVSGFASAERRPVGDSRLLARVPAPPGYPEGVAIHGGRMYVCGPASFGNFQPSSVLVYDLASGALWDQLAVTGQDFTRPHFLGGCVFREPSRLYVVDSQQGVITFDVNRPSPGEQVWSGPLPDLPLCLAVPPGTPCSPTFFDQPPFPNEIAFDACGYGYVSDSTQAAIWRIPPGGGAPQLWFADPRLASPFLGPNGITVSPDGRWVYVAMSLDLQGMGPIYRLPVGDAPTAGDLETVFVYPPGQGPDGIVFGRSGRLYVALAQSSQISVLEGGVEVARFSGPAAVPGQPGVTVPWANPATIALDHGSRSLLVTNHAILTPNPEPLFGVFDVFVNDQPTTPVNRSSCR